MPAAMRSPAHPDGLFGQLTGWRNKQAWFAHIPVAVARPAVAQARLALKAHEAAVQARSARLNEESAAWARWMSEHPAWDPGAWDALDAEEKRLRAKAGLAPPRSVSTWRDERASDGSRRALLRKRKRSARRAVTWNTGPLRVDVVPRTKRPRATPRVAGADMGCAPIPGPCTAARLSRCPTTRHRSSERSKRNVNSNASCEAHAGGVKASRACATNTNACETATATPSSRPHTRPRVPAPATACAAPSSTAWDARCASSHESDAEAGIQRTRCQLRPVRG